MDLDNILSNVDKKVRFFCTMGDIYIEKISDNRYATEYLFFDSEDEKINLSKSSLLMSLKFNCPTNYLYEN